MKHLGEIPSWHPTETHRKFLYKNDKIFKAKQRKIVRAETHALHEDAGFARNLRSGSNFLVCVETSNLEAMEPDHDERLTEFLSEASYQHIWTIGRSADTGRKNECSEQYIEIMDLLYKEASLNRSDFIHVKCPMKDVIMVVLIEPDDKVDIVVHSKYLEITKNKRSDRCVVKAIKQYKTFFGDPSANSKPVKSVEKSKPSSSANDDSDLNRNAAKSPDGKHVDESHVADSQSLFINSEGEDTALPNKFEDVTIEKGVIHVRTETRGERFKISNASDEPRITSKFWVERTKEKRAEQWNEDFINKHFKFNLFDAVRRNKAHGLVFIPYDQVIPKEEAIKKIRNYWRLQTRQPVPKEPLFYVIFDRCAEIPFLGMSFDLSRITIGKYLL